MNLEYFLCNLNTYQHLREGSFQQSLISVTVSLSSLVYWKSNNGKAKHPLRTSGCQRKHLLSGGIDFSGCVSFAKNIGL